MAPQSCCLCASYTVVEDIIAHKWEGNIISFLVQWNLGDTTWEPYAECKELAALD
jgi:hypothetical protein